MTELHYNCSGEGRPLVILHGLFGSAKNWQTLARRFAQHFQVFTVDLRNHGQSFHSPQMNYSVMAEDVVRMLEQLQLPPSALLGHSMGGKVAMTVAMQRPDLLSRLLIADIAPVAYTHEYDHLLNPVVSLDLSRYTSRAAIDQALQAGIPDAQLRGFLLHNLAREGDSWQWRVNWSAIAGNINALVAFDTLAEDWVCSLPTLFLRGAKSDYVADEQFETIERHFSHAEIQTIDGAGHWLHAEKPDEFFDRASSFLLEG